MTESVVQFFQSGPLIALAGNPNCGKTALFNRLTGSNQKVANYAGVTVERKEGKFVSNTGKTFRVLDLPGAYSLHPRSPDESVTTDVLNGRAKGERRPDLVICVVDAMQLRRNLRLVMAIKRLGIPCIVALNMVDQAHKNGLEVKPHILAEELGLPVVSTVAIQNDGIEELRNLLDDEAFWRSRGDLVSAPQPEAHSDPMQDHESVKKILARMGLEATMPHQTSDSIDRIVLHPVIGPAILMVLLFFVFQAVFSWAEAPMGLIEDVTGFLGEQAGMLLPHGWLSSFVVDGLIAGVGGVFVFLPQILILFFFILILEESGYLPRAAFLLDRLMGSVGLSGRSFIPLLSSFACAIPGIMAARTINNPRDRLVTILIAPLMTCSARLPVYALLIGAFVPQRTVWNTFNLQGLVLFGLYFAGIFSAMAVAWVLKHFTTQGQVRTLMMELPTYHWPRFQNVALGLWQRVTIFVRRVGGIILGLTILIWFLSSFPAPPPGATAPAIEYSLAGILGKGLAVLFEPIGFNWQISIALVPGLAAREVAVSALGTVYALSATGDDASHVLMPLIAHDWSLPTALSLLIWYVFAPMCLSTLATIKRETNGWAIPLATAGYLFGLAYAASFLTYRLAIWAL